MSGLEIAGLVLAIPSTLGLINRTVAAIKAAKNVSKGILELLEVIRTDVERLSELSREHAGFFANPTIRNSVQGLHDDLEAVLRGCEAKYLGKRSPWRKVKKMLSEGDVDRDLTRMHQKIQKAYSKWIFEITLQTNGQVGGLEARFQGLEINLDVKSSSPRIGSRRLSEDRGKKGKTSRKTKVNSQGMHAKIVGSSNAKVGRKRGNIEEARQWNQPR